MAIELCLELRGVPNYQKMAASQATYYQFTNAGLARCCKAYYKAYCTYRMYNLWK
jgi:hypothetical protein